MNCDDCQTELLNLAELREPPALLRAHLTSCPACQLVLDRLLELEGTIAELPVPPSSATVRATFLDQLQTNAPAIIRRESPLPRKSVFGSAFADASPWRVASSVAASVLVLAGIWWAFQEPSQQLRPGQAHRRHELLARQVRHTVALAQATTAPKRLTIWNDVARDLDSEVQKVYRVAGGDEMNKLSTLFETAVQNGIIGQAEAINGTVPVVERNQLLQEAITKLTETERQTKELSQAAPPQSREALQRIADTAKKGKNRLETLLQQGGA